MILVIIEGVNAQRGVNPAYLKERLRPTEVTVGSMPPSGTGIAILKCGKHREHLAAADVLFVHGECTSAPPDAKRYPAEIDIDGEIIKQWDSMMEEEVEPESKEMEG